MAMPAHTMPMQDLAETRVGHPRTGGHAFWDPELASAEDQYAKRARIIKPQFPNGIVSSASFVSTTNTASSLAGFVSLALALTLWRSPGSSEKFCPAS